MIKEFLSNKRNRIIITSVLVLLLVIVIILCICLNATTVTRTSSGIDYTKVKSFGKSVGFPGTVYESELGEIRILIKNDTNTYFVVAEQSDDLSIVADTYTEDDVFYQQFRVEHVSDDSDSSKESDTTSDTASTPHFVLENSPKNLAFDVLLAVDQDGVISFSDITEHKNHVSSDAAEGVAALKAQYSGAGFLDGISIVSSGEYALYDSSNGEIPGNNLMVYYKDKYVDMFITDAANEQKILDYYKDIAEASVVTVGDISLNVLKSEFVVSGVFTKDGVACLVNGFEEETALTGFVKSLAK